MLDKLDRMVINSLMVIGDGRLPFRVLEAVVMYSKSGSSMFSYRESYVVCPSIYMQIPTQIASLVC